jgi:uncharacterized membrane protein
MMRARGWGKARAERIFMDVVFGVLILLLGIVVVVFSRHIAELQTKLLPDSFASFESIGCWFNIIVGVCWIILGIYLMLGK